MGRIAGVDAETDQASWSVSQRRCQRGARCKVVGTSVRWSADRQMAGSLGGTRPVVGGLHAGSGPRVGQWPVGKQRAVGAQLRQQEWIRPLEIRRQSRNEWLNNGLLVQLVQSDQQRERACPAISSI